jgi:2-polyprenyl-3-methyl-5-hydroxy-6-metoxy-1,4-benzoquinol methylase
MVRCPATVGGSHSYNAMPHPPPPPSSARSVKGTSPLAGMRILDVSAGGGLCALGCAMAGATVVATDIPSQLGLLTANVERAAHTFTGELVLCCAALSCAALH